MEYIVTGTSTSRLSELRKYTTTENFADQYVNNGSIYADGVDYINSPSTSNISYYIGGIKYNDVVGTTGTSTTFSFAGQNFPESNFENKPIYQNPNKENIVSAPKINDDVFITRQELSVLDGNYRMEYMERLVDIETYASGKFFNIFAGTQ